jgi:putative PEP-CTERM system TPR-repeat lipoprotein
VRLGAELARQGQIDEGITELEWAYQLNPDDNRVVEALVRQYLDTGKNAQALSLAQAHLDRRPDQALPHVLLGMVHVSLKDKDAAEKAFQQALSIDPGAAAAHNGLAVLATQNKELKVAERYYRQALEYRPGDNQTVLNLITLKRMQGDKNAIGEILEEAIAARPQATGFKLMLGRIYMEDGEVGKTLNILEGVEATTNTQNANVIGLRSEAQLAAGRFSEARRSLKELLDLAPETAAIHFYLAQVAQGLNERAIMREELNKASQIDAKYLPAKMALARMAVEDRQIDTAKTLMAELEGKVENDNEVFILTKAQLAELSNDLPTAITGYQKLFDINPGSGHLLRLTRAQWRHSGQATSLQNLQNWVRDHPDQTLVQHDLAQRYIALQRHEEAVDIYTAILKVDRDDALALNNLAGLLIDTRPTAALDYAQRVYTLMPEDPAVMDTLAEAMLAMKDVVGAQRMVDRALAKQPENPDFLYRKAQVHAAAGERNLAMEVLDGILGSDGQFTQRDRAGALRKRLNREN